ncbi:MAG: hypothetical protein WCD45_04975, partial [Gallionella sp.]
QSGAFGEDCLSHLWRVPQPPGWASNAGNRIAMADWGRLLWVTFLGETRKVIGCRATPDGSAFKKFKAEKSAAPTMQNCKMPHIRLNHTLQ